MKQGDEKRVHHILLFKNKVRLHNLIFSYAACKSIPDVFYRALWNERKFKNFSLYVPEKLENNRVTCRARQPNDLFHLVTLCYILG
jgi:hypothetical protein